jgi:hypothetical protein
MPERFVPQQARCSPPVRADAAHTDAQAPLSAGRGIITRHRAVI